MRKQHTQNIEGYWYSEYEKQYPMPVPNVLTNEEAQVIYDLILEKQEEALERAFRGCSRSRITDRGLGNKEYHTNDWIWTGDLAKHYVLDHKVKPSDEFLSYIGYNEINIITT